MKLSLPLTGSCWSWNCCRLFFPSQKSCRDINFSTFVSAKVCSRITTVRKGSETSALNTALFTIGLPDSVFASSSQQAKIAEALICRKPPQRWSKLILKAQASPHRRSSYLPRLSWSMLSASWSSLVEWFQELGDQVWEHVPRTSQEAKAVCARHRARSDSDCHDRCLSEALQCSSSRHRSRGWGRSWGREMQDGTKKLPEAMSPNCFWSSLHLHPSRYSSLVCWLPRDRKKDSYRQSPCHLVCRNATFRTRSQAWLLTGLALVQRWILDWTASSHPVACASAMSFYAKMEMVMVSFSSI